MVSLLLQAQVPANSAALTGPSYPYETANYIFDRHSDALRIFPSRGNAITIALPFRLHTAMFGPDGKSIYGVAIADRADVARYKSGLVRVEFNPTRISPVPGAGGASIRSFAVSSRQDKIVISGNLGQGNCGVFEILLSGGNVRQVLHTDCLHSRSWDDLSLSPNGEQAIATFGSNIDRNLHLEMIDLVHGTTRSLGGEFVIGAWSPDGKWIVVREGGPRDQLFLMDATDFSRRRSLGGAVVLMPAWSPDSRYLLLWKGYLFRCGIYADLEPPATLETLDVQSGKRSTIRVSAARLRRARPAGSALKS